MIHAPVHVSMLRQPACVVRVMVYALEINPTSSAVEGPMK